MGFPWVSPQVQLSDTLEFHCCTVALRCTRRRAASAAVIPNTSATAGLPWDVPLRETGRTGPGHSRLRQVKKLTQQVHQNCWTQDPAAVTLCGCSCIFRLLYEWADECRLDIWNDQRGQQDLGIRTQGGFRSDGTKIQKVQLMSFPWEISLHCRQGTRITLSTCTDMGCLDLTHGSRTWCLQENLSSEFPEKNLWGMVMCIYMWYIYFFIVLLNSLKFQDH